jgi:hypothetical protein
MKSKENGEKCGSLEIKVSTEGEMLPHDPSRGRSFRPQFI